MESFHVSGHGAKAGDDNAGCRLFVAFAARFDEDRGLTPAATCCHHFVAKFTCYSYGI